MTDVERVTGHPAESFETILRRTIADRPDLKTSLPRRLRALLASPGSS